MTVPFGAIVQGLGPGYSFDNLRTAWEQGYFKDQPPEVQSAVQQFLADKQQLDQAQSPVQSESTAAQPTPVGLHEGPTLGQEARAAGEEALSVTPAGVLGSTVQSVRRMAGGEPIVQAVKESFATQAPVLQQYGHDISAGLIPAPRGYDDLVKQQAFDHFVKPAVLVASMYSQGKAISAGLGLVSKMPVASVLAERLPERAREVGVAMGVNATLGAPSDTPNDPLAQKLTDMGLNPHLANAASGAATGGLVTSAFFGLVAGLQAGRVRSLANVISEEDTQRIKDALVGAGVKLEPNADKATVIRALYDNPGKVVLHEAEAAAMGARLAHEQHIFNLVFDPNTSAALALADDDQRVLASTFRNNPGGVSVATGITNPDAVQAVSEKLGVKLHAQKFRAGTIEQEIEQTRPQMPTEAELQAAGTPDARGKLLDSRIEAIRSYGANKINAAPDGTIFTDETGSQWVVDVNSRTGRRYVHILDENGRRSGTVYGGDSREAQMTAGKGVWPAPVKPTQQVPVYDVVISRPDYRYEPYAVQPRQVSTLTRRLSKMADNQGNVSYLLADGTPVRVSTPVDRLAAKLRLRAPTVEGASRPDLALKIGTQSVRLTVTGEPGALNAAMELPHKLTQEQFEALGRAVDGMNFDHVDLSFADGSVQGLDKPVGAQVQDVVAQKLAPVSVKSRLNRDVLAQYKRQGVFAGQAGVLADGSPVEIQGRAGLFYSVRDPLTGEIARIHPDRMTVLPTSLSNELAPSPMFMESFTPEEQRAFARLRKSALNGLAQPITKFSELEQFASTRGFFARSLKGGQVELTSATDGGTQVFDGTRSAVAFMRKHIVPAGELTPPEMQQMLGQRLSLGYAGGGGAPPNINETLRAPGDDEFNKMAERVAGHSAGALQQLFTPSRGLFLDLDQKYGTKFFEHFQSLHEATTDRTNFMAQWFSGALKGLPDGVMPLQKIKAFAGRGANPERITAWLEAADKSALEAEMTTGEVRAAKELRKWYNALFDTFGIEADWVENYAPRIREMQPSAQGGLPETWQALTGKLTGLPRGTSFWADNARTGELDFYDLDAWRVATKYLSAGAKNRFVSAPAEAARQYALTLAGDPRTNRIVLPFAQFLQAVKGAEFSAQRDAVNETLRTFIRNLPGGASQAGTADRLFDLLTGSVYTSTQGLRPGNALRNAFSALNMVWPMYDSRDFWPAVARALTREGKDEAIVAGAIAKRESSTFSRDVIQEMNLPDVFHKIDNASMYLYDNADEFTRSVAYHAGKARAQRALLDLADRAPSADMAAARKRLVKDAGLHMQDPQVAERFMRMATSNPEAAARFAGVQASDVANFLYGRGMQPRWMRSLGGRMFGQFFTWPLWYVDYNRRIVTNLWRNGYIGEIAKFLGKQALINLAIAEAGKEVLHIDLGKWMSYPSVFYSGGPMAQVATGVMQMFRGLGSSTAFEDNPYAQSNITEGRRTIVQSLPAFLPFYYAGRDALRLKKAIEQNYPAGATAALLGTQPTNRSDVQHRLDILLGTQPQPYDSSDPGLRDFLNTKATGGQLIDLDQVEAELRAQARGVQQSAPNAPIGTQTQAAPTSSQPSGAPAQTGGTALTPLKSTVPPKVHYAGPGESKPIPY